MRELAEALNEMMRLGVLDDYALFGTIAQMRYTEPVATLAQRHGLGEVWRQFETKFLDA